MDDLCSITDKNGAFFRRDVLIGSGSQVAPYVVATCNKRTECEDHSILYSANISNLSTPPYLAFN